MRVGPSRPTAPAGAPSIVTGATMSAQVEQRLVAVLRANGDRETLVEDVLDERDDEQFLFEDREDLADGFDAVEDLGHLGRAADEDLLAVGDRLLGVQRADRFTHELAPRGRVATGPAPGVSSVVPMSSAFNCSRRLHHLFGRRVEGRRDAVLHHRTVGEDRDEQVVARVEVDQLGAQDRGVGVAGADDDRRVARQLTEQRRGLFEDVLDLTAHAGEELLHLLLLDRTEDARLQVVDEVAIALVGRDASGRRVGLGEVALALEGDHLGAHRRRRDVEVGAGGDRGGTDGLGACRCARRRPPSRIVALRASRSGTAVVGVRTTRRAMPPPC